MRYFVPRIIVPTSLAIVLTLAAMPAANAQAFNVIWSFTGAGGGGEVPEAGVTLDGGGNLYGTTYYGGSGGQGSVFKLAHKGSGWVLTPLYSFTGPNDGNEPRARVIFGPNGTLYGTTFLGGGRGVGTVFNLRPTPTRPPTPLTPWIETVLYSFTGATDGAYPGYGDLVFDQAGDLYGTTSYAGVDGFGTVFKLTPSGGGWTDSVIYSFAGGNDGSFPYSGVIFDSAGNLYGTTTDGGANGGGTVYQLTPSGSGWTKNVLWNFQESSDGSYPVGGVIFDQAGNLYGTTADGGLNRGGTVYELTPSGGEWVFTVLYSFSGDGGPFGGLAMDAAGNLYGTTYADGAFHQGSVFKLAPSSGSWIYTDLYDFGTEGTSPIGGVVLDASGNLYGTASTGGNGGCGGNGCGLVWEITP